MKIHMPEHVNQIIHTLVTSGYEAYAVGGCVRDSVLGRIPDDWDITTSAQPHEVKKLFRRTVDTGIDHGTVTVLIDKEGYEVTTYRIDGEYLDSRRPKEVIFTSSLVEDLKRRDFTINAMAYNDEQGIIDCFEGMQDIKLKRIRCVGIAEERFTEDALRIMRAIRFSAQLGYEIEANTKEAIKKLAPTLKNISAERIQVELLKLVISPHPMTMKDLYEMGITAVIMPEFDRIMETGQHNPHHIYSVGEHTLHVMNHVENNKVLRLAALFHDFGKPQTKSTDHNGIDHFKGHAKIGEEEVKKILKRLHFDNDTIHKVSKLVLHHSTKIPLDKKELRKFLSQAGDELFPMLLTLKRADAMAQSNDLMQKKLDDLDQLEVLFWEIKDRGECFSLKTLAVTGNDLIQKGLKPGKELGEILQFLLSIVLEDPACNKKEYLLGKLEDFQR